jgi:hypothetical protein
LAIAPDTGGRSVAINVTIVDPVSVPPVESVVLAEPVAQVTDSVVTSSRVRVEDGRGVVRLVPGVWRIQAIVPDRWSWPIQVVVSPQAAGAADVRLEVSPYGWIAGTVAGSPLPAELRAYVDRSVTHASFANSFMGTPVVCPVKEGGRWACRVPGVKSLDLKLEAAGFAPRYMWNLAVPPGETKQTGALTLFRGASVAGWVLAANSNDPKPDAVVELRAPDMGRLRDDARALQFSARTNGGGFFQIGPTPSGAYRLIAASGVSVSTPEPCQVASQQEVRVASPLVLVPPLTLRVSIDPPRAPEGRPWLVQLLRRQGLHSAERVVSGDIVSDAGLWSMGNLPAGEYQFAVTTGDGSTWYARTLDLQPGTEEEVVTVEALHVVGSVSLGDKPTPARVKLSEVKSKVRVSLLADEGGSLSGYLPNIALDSADWVAEVELSEPPVRHTFRRFRPELTSASKLRFDLRLPDGGVGGKVVDEQGNPQPASVYASRVSNQWDKTPVEGGDSVSVGTETESTTGRFTFVGLKAGTYRIYAMGRGEKAAPAFQSDVATLRIDPDPEHRAESTVIVLKRAPVLSGRVLSATATGVPGATVHVIAAGATDVPVRVQTTDAEGRFLAHVPAGAPFVSINVAAIGVGRRTLGRPVPATGAMDISLDPVGGTLVLDMGESKEPDLSVFVYHDGGLDDLVRLAQWSRANGEVPTGGMLRAPLMSPGEYRLCKIGGFQEFGAFFGGTLPEDRCRQGYLWQGGELRLSMPSPVKPK